MIALVICICIVAFCMWIQYEADDMNRKIENRVTNRGEEIRRELKRKGKVKYFAYFKSGEYFAVVDNYLHVNIGTLKGKTNINNVMGTEIKYQVSEKNRMRFVSVMPTYDKYTKLVGIELILYRRNNGDVNFLLDPNIASEQQVKKLKMVLDEMIEEGKVSDKS